MSDVLILLRQSRLVMYKFEKGFGFSYHRIRVGNSIIGFLRESLVFCKKWAMERFPQNKWAIRSFTHFWWETWATWETCSNRSLKGGNKRISCLFSKLSKLYKKTYKKNYIRKKIEQIARFLWVKQREKTRD